MKTTINAKKVTQKDLTYEGVFKTATSALKLQKRIMELSVQLDLDKGLLREAANGDTLSITVPMLGAVTVRKGSEPSSTTVYGLDIEQFNRLDRVSRDRLMTLGVVTCRQVDKPAGTPSVVITPNK